MISDIGLILTEEMKEEIENKAQKKLQKKYHKCSTLKRFLIVRNELDEYLEL